MSTTNSNWSNPAGVGGEASGDTKRAVDQRALTSRPHSLVGQLDRLCQVYEGEPRWELLGQGGVDKCHAAAARQVPRHGVPGGMHVDLRLEARGSAGGHHRVVEAREPYRAATAQRAAR